MESKHILSVERFKELARPTSKHIDEGDVMTFVRECEEIKIIPAIGLERFKKLLDDPEDSRNKTLLEGGEYNDKCGKRRIADGCRILRLRSYGDGRWGYVNTYRLNAA